MSKKSAEKEAPKINKDIASIITSMQGKYGTKSLQLGGVEPIEKIPTGIWALDVLMGGGIPRRRYTQFWGGEDCGKTTTALTIAGVVQKLGGLVAYINPEGKMDPTYAASLGVDVNGWLYGLPKTLEESLTIVKDASDKLDLIVVDSVCAVGGMKEQAKIEKEGLEGQSMMVTPQALSYFFRNVTPIMANGKAAVLFINQLRISTGYIVVDTYAGGNSLRHNLGFCAQFRRGPREDQPKIGEGKDAKIIGKNINVKVTKNHIGGVADGNIASFNIYHHMPYLRPVDDMIPNAMARDVITRKGKAWVIGETTICDLKEDITPTILADEKLQKVLAAAMKEVRF